MTQRWLAQFCSLAAAMSIASLAKAGVWGTQPVIGVAADYYSNPALLDIPNTAESHAALLLDAPTTYNGDAFKFTVLPSFRVSNSEGYSSLDSDYEHLTVVSEFDTERDVFTATGALARDSSLYHDYLLNGSTGVRRDTATADLNWDRQLTERFELTTDVNSTRVRFGESVGTATLVDYKYTSITPTLSWAESERGKLTLAADVARYNSLTGETQSSSANLQLGFVQKLTEIWSLSASGGYSRADNRSNSTEEALEITPLGLIIVLIPVTFESTQNGSVYSVNLSRQTELLTLSGIASRQLVPTGFAFLSRQDSYEIKATYNGSERWTFSGDLHRLNYQQPENPGATLDLNITYLQISAAWQWTEYWTLSMNASRVMERSVTTSTAVSSSGVSLELSRQFDWKSFQ
jgi:hypothetical protein